MDSDICHDLEFLLSLLLETDLDFTSPLFS